MPTHHSSVTLQGQYFTSYQGLSNVGQPWEGEDGDETNKCGCVVERVTHETEKKDEANGKPFLIYNIKDVTRDLYIF